MNPFKFIVEVDKVVWSTWSILMIVLFEDRIWSSEMSIFKIIESRWRALLSFRFGFALVLTARLIENFSFSWLFH